MTTTTSSAFLRRLTRRTLVLAGTAALALSTSLALGGTARAADKVKVGVFPVSSAMPYFVALERGSFKGQNIDAAMVKLMGSPPIVQGMLTGDLDAGAHLVPVGVLRIGSTT